MTDSVTCRADQGPGIRARVRDGSAPSTGVAWTLDVPANARVFARGQFCRDFIEHKGQPPGGVQSTEKDRKIAQFLHLENTKHDDLELLAEPADPVLPKPGMKANRKST